MIKVWLALISSVLSFCEGREHNLVALSYSEDGWECDVIKSTNSALTESVNWSEGRTIRINITTSNENYQLITKIPTPSSHCEGFAHEREIYLIVSSDAHSLTISDSSIPIRSQPTTLSNSNIIHRTMQLAGLVQQQPNVVFLSSGYLSGEHENFFRDVSRAIDGVVGIEPYDKYFGLWNIYAVFQPSAERGASHPSNGISVDTNLDCSYGKTTIRALSCSSRLVAALAATVPAVDSRIVIVNDITYGGTGGTNTAVVYNGEYLGAVLAHELGHSIADLSDEYDFQLFESDHIPLANCWSGSGSIPWAGWIDAGEVLQKPSPVCGYSNYYKPTNEECIMFSTVGESFCPVCKEAIVKSIYDMKPAMKIGTPRCPLSAETTIVNKSHPTAALHVNPRWGRRVDCSITWKVNNTIVEDVTQSNFVFNANSFIDGPIQEDQEFIITATISDLTPWVLQKPSNLIGIETFNVILTSDASKYECTHRSCDGLFTGSKHCSVCKEGVNCTITAQFHPYEPPLGLGKAFKEALAELSGITLAIITGVGVLVCGGWCLIRSRLANEEGFDIEEFTRSQKYMHRYVLCLSVVYLMASASAIIYLIYIFQYNDESVSETFFIIMMGVCGGYKILRLVLLSAVCCKSRILFSVSALLLFIEEGVYCFGTLMINMYVKDLWGKRNDVRASLKDYWEDQVSTNSELICAVQRNLGCSGWSKGCFNTPNVFQCPSSCERSNTNTEPCSVKLEDWFTLHYNTMTAVFSITAILFFAAFLFSVILACSVRLLTDDDPAPVKPRRRPKRAWESIAPQPTPTKVVVKGSS